MMSKRQEGDTTLHEYNRAKKGVLDEGEQDKNADA